MASSTDGTPLWEQFKENAAPLERGRNVSVLEESFQTSANDKQATLQHYERIVKPYEQPSVELSANDDPLIHWLSYIKFHQEAFPSDTNHQFLLLERCFRSMSRHAKYKDDVRFVRVCVMYAEKTSREMEIFKHLYTQRVGVKTTIFWAAWAWKAEKDEDFQFADQIYTKGMQKFEAGRLDVLQKRYSHFQRRLARHMARLAENQGLDQEEYEQGTRGALGGLSQHAVRRNDRSQTSSYGGRSTTRSNALPTTTTATYRDRRSNNRAHVENVPPSNGSFAIFTDEGHNPSFLDDSFAADVHRHERILETDQDVRKENTQAAEMWNERGGLYREAPVSAAMPGGGATVQQSLLFSVHVDENCIARHEREEAARREQEHSMRRQRDERFLQDRVDGGIGAILVSDPLRYARDPTLVAADQLRHHAPESNKRPLANKLVERTTTDARPRATEGFDKKLLFNPLGVEQSFEEARARAMYYKLASSSDNFNLLREATIESHSMDFDNDVSMTEDESLSTEQPPAEPAVSQSSRRPLAPRPVDADTSTAAPSRSVLMEDTRPPLSCRTHLSLNTSLNDTNRSLEQNTPCSQSYLSNASSTVDETIAASVPRGKEDQTINTALALKELSMMFGSPALPAVAEGSPTRLGEFSISDALGNLEPSASFVQGDSADEENAEDNNTAPFQIFCDDDKDDLKSHSVFEIYKDESTNKDERSTLNVRSDYAESHSLLEPTTIHPRDENRFESNIASSPAPDRSSLDNDGGDTAPIAEIYAALGLVPEPSSQSSPKSDTENQSTENLANIRNNRSETASSDGDATVSLSELKEVLGIADKETTSGGFLPVKGHLSYIKEADDEESVGQPEASVSSESDQDSDTVSLSELNEVLGNLHKDTTACVMPTKSHLSYIKGDDEEESIGLPAIPVRETRTEDSDDETFQGFGDVSGIAFVDEPTLTMPVEMALKRSVEYATEHKTETLAASKQIQASGQGHLSVKESLTEVLATEGLICSCRTHVIPRALKLPVIEAGSEIKIDRKNATIKHELGRGAFGTVVLLETNNRNKMLALKVQRPTSSLVLEFDILRKLADRLHSRNPNAMGQYFPRPLAYISLADGAMMSMTAGSLSGVNLVDLVNLYKNELDCNVPGIVALHYTSRMLHHLEMMHWHGQILHCDTKPDNWVLCLSDQLIRVGFPIDGAEVMLVDFGRAVDLASVARSAGITGPMEALLTGEASHKPMQCVSMRNGLPWSFDIDTFGVCAAAHVLLFGTQMEIALNSKRRWMPVEQFEQNNQKLLWTTIFDSLLNLDDVSRSAISSHPQSVRQLRNQIDGYLSSRKDKLESALHQQALLLPSPN